MKQVCKFFGFPVHISYAYTIWQPIKCAIALCLKIHNLKNTKQKTIIIVTSKITDHYNKCIRILKSLKYCENYQNVTERNEVSKCYWKNGTVRFVWHSLDTNPQFVKNTMLVKCNRMKSVCILLWSYFIKWYNITWIFCHCYILRLYSINPKIITTITKQSLNINNENLFIFYLYNFIKQ